MANRIFCLLFLLVALFWQAPQIQGADEEAASEAKALPAERPQIALVQAGEMRGHTGPLYHAIMEEAFLATARDEFGAITYDGVLREQAPQAASERVPVWEVITIFDPRRANIELTLTRKPGASPKRTWKYKLAIEKPSDDGMEREVARAEQAIHQEFFEAIKSSGFAPQPRAWYDEGPAPEKTEDLLANLCLPAQFEAIRKAHAQIAEQGESPERLIALARGYANLGILTEHLWTTSTKALTARSLMYAERLCVKQPDSAAAYWCRGYVRALAGRQQTALADFEKAHQLSEKNGPTIPPWGALAEAFCKFDATALNEGVDEHYVPLARWLYYLAIEPSHVSGFVQEAANSVLDKIPDAYRPIDLFSKEPHWSLMSEGSHFGYLASAAFLYTELGQLEDLPEKVKKVCDEAAAQREQSGEEFRRRARLIKALRQSGESVAQRGELSWSALATLLEDVALVQISRGLIAGDSGETLKDALPLVESHPYRALLGLQSDDDLLVKAEVQNMEKLGLAGLTINAEPLFDRLYSRRRDLYERLAGGALGRADDTYYDQWRESEGTDELKDEILFEHLVKIAPNMPISVSCLLTDRHKKAEAHVGQWEKQYADVPDVVLALARFYRDDGKNENVIRLCEQEIKTYPNHDAFSLMAETYLQQWDEKNWLETWDDYFEKVPDTGWEHGICASKIAWQLMEEHRWEDAMPYAKRTLPIGAAWGYATTACCAEGQQNWELAEVNFAEESKAYSEQAFKWYEFCRRTGHGDRAAAEALVTKEIAANDASTQKHPPYFFAIYYLLNKEYEKANRWMKEDLQESREPVRLFETALVSDRLKDTTTRNAALRRILTECSAQLLERQQRPNLEVISLAELVSDDLAKGGEGKIDLDEAARRCASAPTQTRSAFYYLLGEYLDIHNQPEAAVRCWEQAMLDVRLDTMARTLAGARLLEQGIMADSYKEALQKPLSAKDLKLPPPPKLRHTPDAVEFGGHYYKFVANARGTWKESKAIAEYMGGHLTSISSDEEQEFVANLCNKKSAWLGGFRENGQWKWVTDEPFQFERWSHADIVESHLKMLATGLWAGGSNYTNQANGFVVEWDK